MKIAHDKFTNKNNFKQEPVSNTFSIIQAKFLPRIHWLKKNA